MFKFKQSINLYEKNKIKTPLKIFNINYKRLYIFICPQKLNKYFDIYNNIFKAVSSNKSDQNGIQFCINDIFNEANHMIILNEDNLLSEQLNDKIIISYLFSIYIFTQTKVLYKSYMANANINNLKIFLVYSMSLILKEKYFFKNDYRDILC